MTTFPPEWAERWATKQQKDFIDYVLGMPAKLQKFNALISSGDVEPISERDFRLPFRIVKAK